MKVWIDLTASAHVLVFRPLIEILEQRGAEVQVTARDYSQTLQLLELHGIEATVLGRHGGRTRRGKATSLFGRLSISAGGRAGAPSTSRSRTAPTS